MPFTGFVCDATDQAVSIDACLACARNGALPGCHMTAPVIAGILNGLRPDDFGLTVTTLLGCPRKWRLMQETEYFVKPSQAWWAYRGQMFHGVAASYAAHDPDAVAEQRFSTLVEMPDMRVEISGQPDLIYVGQRSLIDYKTRKEVPRSWRTYACPETGDVIREGPWAIRTKVTSCSSCGGEHEAKSIEQRGDPRPDPHHVQQISLYRLILWENGIPIDSATVVYQDMGQQLRLPVEMLNLEDTQALLEERLRLFLQDDLPPVLTDADEVWVCDYCPVRQQCESRHGGPVGKAAASEVSTGD